MRINGMLADYGDVVPRREFEMLETSFTVCYIYYITSYNIIITTDIGRGG